MIGNGGDREDTWAYFAIALLAYKLLRDIYSEGKEILTSWVALPAKTWEALKEALDMSYVPPITAGEIEDLLGRTKRIEESQIAWQGLTPSTPLEAAIAWGRKGEYALIDWRLARGYPPVDAEELKLALVLSGLLDKDDAVLAGDLKRLDRLVLVVAAKMKGKFAESNAKAMVARAYFLLGLKQ